MAFYETEWNMKRNGKIELHTACVGMEYAQQFLHINYTIHAYMHTNTGHTHTCTHTHTQTS